MKKEKIKNPNRVTFREKLSFLVVNIGAVPTMVLLSSFFLIFYTDVVGLDPAKLATLFLVSKVMDGISDPIMGYLLDRFRITKYGKFRPLFVIGTIACVINFILLWFGAVWAPTGKYVIVYITYLLLGWIFDIQDISLNSFIPVMSADYTERNGLSFVKMAGYFIGMMIVSVVGPIIVAEGTLQSYYKLIFGSMAFVLVLCLVGVLGIKERVPFTGEESEKYSFKELLQFIRMRPILFTFLATLLFCFATQLQTSTNAYFFTHVMGDMSLMSGISGVTIFGMFPGLILSTILANKIGKKKTYSAGIAVTVIGIALRFINQTSLPILYVSTIMVGIGTGFSLPLNYGIQADNTTYVRYHTGKRAEAAIASLNSFIIKVAQGFAGALPGYILAWTGYNAAAATQTQTVKDGIISCVTTIPIILSVIAFFVFAFGFNLEQKDIEEMTAAIEAKNE